jgi:predicted CxxxxCH...CXXCH cytochrome family protein
MPCSQRLFTLLFLSLMTGAVGCDHELADGQIDGEVNCSTCHGSSANAAPPMSLSGETKSAAPGVGAHQEHLRDGALRAAIACSECHVVPESITEDGHIDPLPAEVTWGPLAAANGAAPEWAALPGRCDSTYCHGATLSGGTTTAPYWGGTGQGQTDCGACHGAPPPPPHPASTDCRACHPGTVDETGAIDVAGGLHIDGKTDVVGGACNACHGSAANPAPPRSMTGAMETTDTGVGAHQAHLTDGALRAALPCDACHTVPGTTDAPGHLDAAPAELTWGALATVGDQAPVWDRAADTCSSTWCHGSGLTGGTNTAPRWTLVGAGQAACGTCHGAPPPAPHPAATECRLCHPGTMTEEGGIDVAGGLHINGEIEVVGSACNTCHGSAANPAPPVSVSGASDTTDTAVGAHQAHLTGGALRAALACDDCHVVPGTTDAEGHLDAAPAELTWGDLSRIGDLAPEWDRDADTCSSTYCHGATLGGGTNKTPLWTVVGAGQAACGTCHGAPPPAPHPASTDCRQCHPDTMAEDGSIDVAGGQHIDGDVDVGGTACTSCHGSAANAAPPVALSGASDPAATEIGAHQAHVTDGALRAALDCSTCHVTPTSITAEGHLGEAPAELTWGDLSRAGDLAPEWDRDADTCSSTWCHGAALSGGTNTTPLWTVTEQGQAACGTCHGAPPPAPHPASPDCALCHPGTMSDDGTIDVAGGLHINGQVEAVGTACNACHGSASNDAPPQSVAGSWDASDTEVGAHQAHVTDGIVRGALACEDCHTVPATMMAPGHLDAAPAELSWGALSETGGLAPVWDRDADTCSSTYCHGATLSGGSNPTPQWTFMGQANCGSCHGYGPPAPHPSSKDCKTCHPGTINTSGGIDIAGGLHINGAVEVIPTSCNTCHGSAANAAPPQAVSGAMETDVTEVGAHQAHLVDGALRAALTCEDCHVLPQTLGAAGHLDAAPAELTWGPLSKTEDLEPEWDRDADTCSSTYCHGATLSGGSNTVPQWTAVDQGQAACGTCHGAPPPPPHTDSTDCQSCHPGTMAGPGVINVAGGLHINGDVEVAGGACGACHGMPPETGSHLIHYQAEDGTASYGGTGITADLLPEGDGYAFDCGNCHPMDAAHHMNGVPNAGGGSAEIELSPDGAPPNSLKAMNLPDATYTPGDDVFEDQDGGLTYTKGTCNGTYCHSRVSLDVPGPVPVPLIDFPFVGYPIVYPPYEANYGRVGTPVTWGGSLSCDGCHGMPPRTEHATVKAGVGDSHSWIDHEGYESMHGWNHGWNPIACTVCHHATVVEVGERTRTAWPFSLSVYGPLPIEDPRVHVNGAADIEFSDENWTEEDGTGEDLSGATWSPISGTCFNVSCHLDETAAVWGSPYRWENVYECNRCHQY